MRGTRVRLQSNFNQARASPVYWKRAILISLYVECGKLPDSAVIVSAVRNLDTGTIFWRSATR